MAWRRGCAVRGLPTHGGGATVVKGGREDRLGALHGRALFGRVSARRMRWCPQGECSSLRKANAVWSPQGKCGGLRKANAVVSARRMRWSECG